MEVSLDNLYVDTWAYWGLNREFTTLPNFLLVLKVLLIYFFRTLTHVNVYVGPPFSTDLILANSESLSTMIGSLTFPRKQWKKFSSAQSKNKIACAKAEAFDLNSVLVCSSLLFFWYEIYIFWTHLIMIKSLYAKVYIYFCPFYILRFLLWCKH